MLRWDEQDTTTLLVHAARSVEQLSQLHMAYALGPTAHGARTINCSLHWQ
jgi:hypothetical protein